MANWVKGDDLLAFINDFGYTVQQCLCTGNSVGRFKLGDCYPGSGNWALCKKVLTTPNLLYTTLELHIFYILHLNSGIGTGKPGGKDATNGWLAKIRTDIFNQIIHRKLSPRGCCHDTGWNRYLLHHFWCHPTRRSNKGRSVLGPRHVVSRCAPRRHAKI